MVSLFITLWVNQYYIDNGLCPQNPSHDNDDIKSSCREAFQHASSLSGVAQVLALVGAPFFGLLADRTRRAVPVLTAGVIGLIGCLGFGLGSDPTAGIAYFWVCLVGLGEIGAIVTSLGLAAGPYVPEDIRGSVAGTYSLCGALGIMLSTKVGGILFDHWWQGGPFVIIGVFHLLIALLALVVWWFESKLPATEVDAYVATDATESVAV